MKENIKLNQSYETISWHTVYKELTELLYRFAMYHKEARSQQLYNLCMNDVDFRKLNRWMKNYEKWENYGLDPVHIFSSFNYANIDKDLRIRKLELYFRLLGSELRYDNISFLGVPTPNITRVMSARNLKSQDEIWQLFCNAIEYKENGISDAFEKVDSWYGIQVPMLTIFLFWIDSDSFFPLDKNTTRLLQSNNKDIPHSTGEYIEMIKENIQDQGIFRELVRVAYE